MEKDLVLLLRGAAIGLVSSLALEAFKQRIEGKRAAEIETQSIKRRRTEKLQAFLRGENHTSPTGQAPYPAWLRQLTVARRSPLARLGLRSDEDFSTVTVRTASRWWGARRFPLLKLSEVGHRRHPASGKRSKFLLGPSHLIGRGSQCDIQILDPTVSGLHALIRFEDGQFVLYDLGSTCGTFVNGCPAGEAGIALQDGEILVMGNTIFEFGCINRNPMEI